MGLEAVPQCPVCACTDRSALHSVPDRGGARRDWLFWGCPACGAAYLDPRPSPEDVGEAYETYFTHEPPAVERPPVSAFARLRRALRNGYVNRRLGYSLEPAYPGGLAAAALLFAPRRRGDAVRAFRHLRPAGRLLDVGCGNGRFVAEMQRAGWRAVGLDIDLRAVDFGRAAGLDVRVERLEEHAASHAGRYDAVVLSHVLEHVPNPFEFLVAARIALRPGGTLWVATPNLGALGHRLYGSSWLALDPPRHFVLFDIPCLRRLLARAGYEDIRHAPYTYAAADSFARSASVRGPRGSSSAAARATALATRLLAGAEIRSRACVATTARRSSCSPAGR